MDRKKLRRFADGLPLMVALLGQRIQAIKVYRELTGADLKTSADAVKAMHP